MRAATHPMAWWGWAAGLAVASTRVADPQVLIAVAGAVMLVAVLHRRGTAPTRLLVGYVVLAAVVVVLRIAFHVVLGIKPPGPVLLDLPTVTLPEWAAGIALLGPVTVPGLVDAATGGLRLATLVLCFGAVNAVVDPRRALRCLPSSMHHLGTAVVIAVSVAPQLVTAAADVRRAQRLRGTRPGALRAGVTPVLADAVDRSLALASSMDARGYARTLPGRTDSRVAGLLLVALLGAAIGVYGLLGGTSPSAAVGALVLGGGSAVIAGRLAGRHVQRTRYRPDRWQAPETVTALAGVTGGLVAVALAPTGAGLGAAVLVALLASVPALTVMEEA